MDCFRLGAMIKHWRPVPGKIAFRIVALLIFISIIITSFREYIPFAPKKHTISYRDIRLEDELNERRKSGTEDELISPVLPADHCSTHNWAPYPDQEIPRKVYDLIMINTELEWLEIRLHELQHHVDYFVILEASTTFTGHSKPLYLKENWDYFSKFHHKIIYHLLEDPPTSNRTWDHEVHQRDATYNQVLPHLQGVEAPIEGDIIIVSDIDEIPRPAALTLIRACDFPRRLSLRMRFYHYSFQWRHRGEQWEAAKATVYTGDTTILPQDLRQSLDAGFFDEEKADLWNAGWHCSSCFRTIGEMLDKMGSFSHVELNKETFRNVERIKDRIRNGKDLWDRFGQWYSRVDNNQDIPGYVKANKKRFQYMLNRDGENAGFED